MMRSLKELNVEKEYVFNKKQTLISDFFLKEQMVMLSVYICCVFDVFLLPYQLKLRSMTPTLLGEIFRTKNTFGAIVLKR